MKNFFSAFFLVALMLVSVNGWAKSYHHTRRSADMLDVALPLPTNVPPVKPETKPMWQVEHDRAVELARQGKFAESFALFVPLYQAHSDDMGLVRDYLAVLSWAGNNDENVTRLYQAIMTQDQPDYVLEAVGRAYRNLKKPAEAVAVYQRGLTRYPAKEAMAVGLVRSLSESGYGDRAVAAADNNIRSYGHRTEVVLAAADAALDNKNYPNALAYYQSVLSASPNNRAAVRGYILAADRGGWHRVAWESANNNPNVLTPAEYREIVGNDTAELVRKGMEDQPVDHSDFKTTDQALQRLNGLISTWQAEGAGAQPALWRAHYDRVLALRNRSQMGEVIRNYEAMQRAGVKPPAYVLSSVADAYLNLQQPEIARDIYAQLVAANPSDAELRRQLFYATMECGDYDNAFLVADGLMLQTGVDGERRISAQLLAGAARLYTGQVSAADPIIRDAASRSNSPSTREAMGNLFMAHGWPRAAYEQYRVGASLRGGKDLSNEVGLANAALAQQHFDEAEQRAYDLQQRYPNSTHAQRVMRDWQIHKMAEFRLKAGYAPQPLSGVNVTGGQSHSIDADIYSAPIAQNWRIFAGSSHTYQKEPRDEGRVTYTHGHLGGEYRNAGLVASLAPTFSNYNGKNRVGGETELSVALDDQWTIAGRGEIMAKDIPLRALNAGVTADAGTAKVTWRRDEETSVSVGGGVMSFSDGNIRGNSYASLAQRLYTAPVFSLDGLLDAGLSWNSKDADRSYYNPRSDIIGLAGVRAVHTLYQRYATLWQHSLRVTPGVYWQNRYGADAALRARYEHRLFLDNTFEAGLGVNYSRQDYDGNAEDDIGASLDLVKRF